MKLVDKITKGILITVLIIAVISVVYLVVFHNPGEGYTEFYMLDHNNNTTDYPTDMSRNSIGKISIGIKNQEHMEMNYTVKVKKDNQTLTKYNKTLKDNEETITPYYIDSTSKLGIQQLDIELYKGNITQPYRTLKLKYNVTN